MEINPLNCSLSTKDEKAIFRFSGTLAIYQTIDLKEKVNSLTEKNINQAINRVIFDLSDLEYLDSYGVSFIIDFNNKFKKMKKNLYLYYGNNNKLDKLFKTIRIGLIIPILENIDLIPD